MLDRARTLARRLETIAEGVRTDLRNYPSGAISLDVFWRDHGWNLVYSPRWGFGIDDMDADGFSYSFVTKDFDAAAQRLEELLRVAVAAAHAE